MSFDEQQGEKYKLPYVAREYRTEYADGSRSFFSTEDLEVIKAQVLLFNLRGPGGNKINSPDIYPAKIIWRPVGEYMELTDYHEGNFEE
jgi:hypothetical protein